MNPLHETARVRALALAGMRSPRDEIIALATLMAPLPVAVHGIVPEPVTATDGAIALAALLVAVAGGVRFSRLRRRSVLRVAARPGPGAHRAGWLSVPLLLAALAAGLFSWWAALAGSVLALVVTLVVVPRHEEAQIRAVTRRISGTSDPLADDPTRTVDFDAPGAVTLAALLQLTRSVSLAAVAGGLGRDEQELVAAARSLESQGAVRTAELKVPHREPTLLVAATPSGLGSWHQHLAALHAGAAPHA